MNTKRIVISSLVFGFILVFYGMAIGDGGGPDPITGCETLPPVTNDSPLIQGVFTASYDKSLCSVQNRKKLHYNIHAVLEMARLINGKEEVVKHLFSFPMPVSPKHICSFSNTDLIEKYQYAACNEKVAKRFGLTGIAVITDLSVTLRDVCDETCNDDRKPICNSMICGTIKLRVEPLPQQ